jgi:hypothetical protein
MRYFVKLDKDDKPRTLYKFNSDEWKSKPGIPIVEQVWVKGEWQDTQTLSEFLVEGGTDLAEIEPGQVKKMFPGSL